MRLLDIARSAKVSVTTVSRVVNEDPSVKASTRARVRRTMEELNYYPNLHARSLAGGRSKTFGFLASNLNDPFFLDIYDKFEQLAQTQGYDSLVMSTHFDPEKLRAAIRLMIGRRVAGIAAMVSEMEPRIVAELSENGTPVVFCDVGHAGKRITNIRFDYRKGMRNLVEYFCSMGHRRLAYVSYPLPLWSTEERRLSFEQTASEYGAAAQVICAGREGPLSGRKATRALLMSDCPPTAILCVNDITAIGVLKELSEQGVSVPRQVSVAGFGNIALGQYTIPSLTTIEIPREEIAQLAIGALLPGQDATVMGHEIPIEPELIVRQSSGPVTA